MNTRQLALLREVIEVHKSKAIPIWIRGGCAVDFALGQITREHEDIDLFAWPQEGERLIEALEQAGFSPMVGSPSEAQRDFIKDEESIQLALPGLSTEGKSLSL